MKYFEEILKKNGWTSIITSIVFAVLGIILINYPEIAVKMVAYVFGAIFSIIGIVKLINYFSTKGKYDFYNYDIAYGIIAILLGIIVMAYNTQIASIFRIIIGVWIVYSSIIRFNLSYKLKTMDVNDWTGSLVISILILICGLWIILTSNALLKVTGVIVLVYSILDIIEGIIFMRNINKMF